MARLVDLAAGLLMLAGAQAGDMADRSVHQGFLSKYMGSDASKASLGDYTKFVPAWSNHMKHQGGTPDALYHHNSLHEHQGFDTPKIVDKEEGKAVQKVLAADSHMQIGMAAVGVSLFALAAMLASRLRRGLQQATTFTRSGGHESDMSVAVAKVGDNILELKVSDSTTSRSSGWLQVSPKNHSSLIPCSATEYLIDNEDVGGPLEPLSDYLLVKVDETSDKTSGGVMLSDKSKEPPPTGVVQSVGPGALHKESGVVLPIDCKVGDSVMWGRYSGANVKYQRSSHTLLKDRDVQMSWTGELTAQSARPIGGKILIKVREEKGQTTSGLFLGMEAQDKASVVGEVIQMGPGRVLRDGSRAPQPCAVGDTVRFQDLDVTECDIEYEEYVLVDSQHVMMKWQAA
jgi:co-chaperonin GroES (HSP10)